MGPVTKQERRKHVLGVYICTYLWTSGASLGLLGFNLIRGTDLGAHSNVQLHITRAIYCVVFIMLWDS